MPTVSVVLPTYDAAPYVEEALQSLVEQRYGDFEVIVVDDGSTDGTLDIVEGFDDDRIRIVRRSDTGITGALNRGIAEAEGKYIARQDGDDVSHPDRLRQQVLYLESNPEVGLVGTATEIVDESGRVVDRRQVLERPTVDRLLSKNRYVHGSVVMRSDVVESVGGYDETFQYTEDYDLWLRIANEYPVRNIDEYLYRLRLRPDSIYGSELFDVKLWELFARKRFRGTLDTDLRSRIESDGDVTPLYESLGRDEQATLHREVGQELLRYHERDAARDHLRHALSSGSYRNRLLATGLFALSYCPDAVEKSVERAYRRVLNRRIEARNRRDVE